MAKETIINFSSNSRHVVSRRYAVGQISRGSSSAAQKGKTPPTHPPLPRNPNKTVARVFPLPPQPNSQKASVIVIRSPTPPKPRYCPYHQPHMHQQTPITEDLLSKMEARNLVAVQFLTKDPPGIETLRQWASSLRLGDGKVDLRLRLGLV